MIFLTFSILPDIVEVDELKNGTRREGIIYGSTMFMYKVGSAIVVAFLTASMSWFGYIENTSDVPLTQSPSAIFGIRLLICAAPALSFILSAFFVRELPLGKEAFEEIKHSITVEE